MDCLSALITKFHQIVGCCPPPNKVGGRHFNRAASVRGCVSVSLCPQWFVNTITWVLIDLSS